MNAFSLSREVTFWTCHVHADCAGRVPVPHFTARSSLPHGAARRRLLRHRGEARTRPTGVLLLCSAKERGCALSGRADIAKRKLNQRHELTMLHQQQIIEVEDLPHSEPAVSAHAHPKRPLLRGFPLSGTSTLFHFLSRRSSITQVLNSTHSQ